MAIVEILGVHLAKLTMPRTPSPVTDGQVLPSSCTKSVALFWEVYHETVEVVARTLQG